TSNWSGKTVTLAEGVCRPAHSDARHRVVDLPGAYSLRARSREEEVARDFLLGGAYDAVVCVADACRPERGLSFALQVREITPRVVVCLNMMDEARARGIALDAATLTRELGVPVVPVSAKRREGLRELLRAVEDVSVGDTLPRGVKIPREPEDFVREAERVTRLAVRFPEKLPDRTRALDRVFTGPLGRLVMLGLLALTLWISLAGANYPTAALARLFARSETLLAAAFTSLGAPWWLRDALLQGVFRSLTWVVAVMLPPMAIFFPLFTVLEDFGYLPRVAYNLDGSFQRARACGKQSMTMCLGLGCNAAGVTGCRIIDAPREKLIAILTNSLMPCNGRFPLLIAVLSMFFNAPGAGGGALRAQLLALMITLGAALTFLASRALSGSLLRGEASSFILELPPYRAPRVLQILTRSLLDRTLFVLGRAAAVAAPAGLVIWLVANLRVGDTSILAALADFLDPAAHFIGLDGVILLAFILAFPANEIVVPIILMGYTAGASLVEPGSLAQLRATLTANGWTPVTAVCVLLFCLAHWPCSTTCLTIKKETGSLRWTAVAVALPTLIGAAMCAAVRALAGLANII
ncbi:MAG: ferrous iron transporter B, partial [Oscillospiraceae bacterium]|nr:ferrous iron transporter B [Oscillospiraceae bacterium]